MGEEENNNTVNEGQGGTQAQVAPQADPQGGANAKNDGNQGNQQNTGERTFTQEDVNRMMTREKNQGRNAVYNELGLDPKDTQAIAMVKALLASQKQDEGGQQAQDNTAVEEAERRALMAEAKAEAMMLGIMPKYVDDAVSLAMPKVDDENDLKSVLNSLKQKYPVWCEAGSNEGGNGEGNANRGTGSTINPNAGNKGNEAKGMGARLAANRRASKPKGSYWKNN